DLTGYFGRPPQPTPAISAVFRGVSDSGSMLRICADGGLLQDAVRAGVDLRDSVAPHAHRRLEPPCASAKGRSAASAWAAAPTTRWGQRARLRRVIPSASRAASTSSRPLW